MENKLIRNVLFIGSLIGSHIGLIYLLSGWPIIGLRMGLFTGLCASLILLLVDNLAFRKSKSILPFVVWLVLTNFAIFLFFHIVILPEIN